MKLRHYIYVLIVLALPLRHAVAQEGARLVAKGIGYAQADDFPMAMRYFTSGMEKAKEEGDKHTLMISLGYIGNVYFNLYDYTRCLQYLLKGYGMAEEMGEKDKAINFLTNIVGAYCKAGDAAKAREYFNILEQTAGKNPPVTTLYYLDYNRARIATAEGKSDLAIRYHDKALRVAIEHRMNEEYALFQYCEIADVYLKRGDYDKAIEYARKCLDPARHGGERDLLTSVYQELADAYALKGDKSGEAEWRKAYLALQDSVFNRRDIFQADKELVEYEAREMDEHIDSLGRRISRQLVVIVAISAAVIALLVLSVLLFRYNRKLKLAHLTLIEKNRELQKADAERERMLYLMADKHGGDTAETEKSSPGISQLQAAELLEKIMKVMNNAAIISDPNFSLGMLAEAVGSNTKYVSWVINDTYGKNFKTLLNVHRIRLASAKLVDKAGYGNMTFAAIYKEVGYTNAVSFIRAFKKVNGMTPSEYQQSYLLRS